MLVFSLVAVAGENATITGEGLRIRETPSMDGSVIGSLSKGMRVEVVTHTDSTDSIDGFTGYWYYIDYKGVSGYVFGKYIKIDTGVSTPSEREYKDTALLSDILGDWPMQYDAPNVTFSFFPTMKARFVESTFVGGGQRVVEYPPVEGTFIFDGKTITAKWDDGTSSVFAVNKTKGVTTLTLNGVVLPPQLHKPAPAHKKGSEKKFAAGRPAAKKISPLFRGPYDRGPRHALIDRKGEIPSADFAPRTGDGPAEFIDVAERRDQLHGKPQRSALVCVTREFEIRDPYEVSDRWVFLVPGVREGASCRPRRRRPSVPTPPQTASGA